MFLLLTQGTATSFPSGDNRRHVLSSIHVTECHFAVAVTMSHQQLKSNVGDISLFSLCFVWFFLENTQCLRLHFKDPGSGEVVFLVRLREVTEMLAFIALFAPWHG